MPVMQRAGSNTQVGRAGGGMKKHLCKAGALVEVKALITDLDRYVLARLQSDKERLIL
jgi:hypothetical protein